MRQQTNKQLQPKEKPYRLWIYLRPEPHDRLKEMAAAEKRKLHAHLSYLLEQIAVQSQPK